MTITLRLTKGTPLTHGELDGNFSDLDGRFPVATANIGDDQVTADKLADNAVLTAAVADANVTFAKIQDASGASKLLGRGDSGAGDFEEITIGAGLSMTGTTLSAAGAGLPTDDTNPLVQDPVDTSKRVRIDAEAVATATTRAIVMGDRDVDLASGGTFAEVSHAHSAADITSGALDAARIGDGTLTNAKLADMVQATFKGRAAGAGTGAPVDLTATQAKTALAITFADITSTASTAQIADDAVTNDKLAHMTSPTVKANVSGVTAAPADVSPSTFKAQFGFGTLADKSQITVSDISTGGTPSVSTFLRGDGQWAGIVPSVSYDVQEIDDVTTLTAAHARYQISGGTLQILKLRLRNSVDQSQPVTVTMPDTDAVTPGGIEFDFIQADDQTGVCTIERETNGTINGVASVALAGARSTAVLIVDDNVGTQPIARLEGETDEARTIQGATTFADQAVFTSGVDVNGASTLSEPLTLDTNGAIVGSGKVASDLELKDIAETFVDAGNKSGAASFDYSTGPWQKCVVTANISSIAITSPPASGKVGTITLEIHQDGAGSKTIAWGAAFRFPGGSDFTLSAAASAIDIFTLVTRDGGATWYAFEGGKAFAA